LVVLVKVPLLSYGKAVLNIVFRLVSVLIHGNFDLGTLRSLDHQYDVVIGRFFLFGDEARLARAGSVLFVGEGLFDEAFLLAQRLLLVLVDIAQVGFGDITKSLVLATFLESVELPSNLIKDLGVVVGLRICLIAFLLALLQR